MSLVNTYHFMLYKWIISTDNKQVLAFKSPVLLLFIVVIDYCTQVKMYLRQRNIFNLHPYPIMLFLDVSHWIRCLLVNLTGMDWVNSTIPRSLPPNDESLEFANYWLISNLVTHHIYIYIYINKTVLESVRNCHTCSISSKTNTQERRRKINLIKLASADVHTWNKQNKKYIN